jgi:NADPH:quinone reductase-like Zn-dependent oxidoreductase
MKQIIYNKFGSEEVLELIEVPMPTIRENQLLIQVKSVSINPLDWKLYRGEMKMMSGKKFPKTVGIDFSGIVANTGSIVSKFKKGDEVFGLVDVFKGGALAEYIVVSEKDIASKPSSISFEQAATLSVTGLSALQIIDDLAKVSPSQEILINGATGGIGMFAVQFAKKKGAIVTTVTSSKGLDLVKKWGADFTIDYSKENIVDAKKIFDTIIDLSGKLSFHEAKKIMKPKANFITTLPEPLTIIGSYINNLYSPKKIKILFLKPSTDELNKLAVLAAENLDIVISKTYSLNEAQRAFKECSEKGIVGKAVINVS